MEVILLEKVHQLGSLGDRVKVRPGYGRNYLIPMGKAVPATAQNVAKFEVARAVVWFRGNGRYRFGGDCWRGNDSQERGASAAGTFARGGRTRCEPASACRCRCDDQGNDNPGIRTRDPVLAFGADCSTVGEG
jgi:hypothetical protein